MNLPDKKEGLDFRAFLRRLDTFGREVRQSDVAVLSAPALLRPSSGFTAVARWRRQRDPRRRSLRHTIRRRRATAACADRPNELSVCGFKFRLHFPLAGASGTQVVLKVNEDEETKGHDHNHDRTPRDPPAERRRLNGQSGEPVGGSHQ